MCIEVFHPELPIIIRYANETLRFTGEGSFSFVYAFLLENASSVPLGYINILFPRPLLGKDDEGWFVEGVHDITDQIPNRLRGCTIHDNNTRLQLTQPDPNRPQFNLPLLDGEWLPGSTQMHVPGNAITEEGLYILKHLQFTFLQADLQGTPLAARKSRWFCWQVDVSNVGILCDSPIGRMAIHQVASPCVVRRTFEEEIEAIQREGESAGPPWLAATCGALRKTLGLTTERRVDIKLLELVVQPGPPNKRFLIDWDAERDLRTRSGSPRWGDDPQREPQGELLYEWKTGSLVSPDHNPWRNDGFTLHLTLSCRK